MTRKRFVKLLMADGYSRNQANKIAIDARNCGMEYKTAYKAESAVMAAQLDLKNIDLSAMCDAIRNIVESVQKAASAIVKAAAAFAKTYREAMEALNNE